MIRNSNVNCEQYVFDSSKSIRGLGTRGSRPEYSGKVSAACQNNRCHACSKLDCPHECHNRMTKEPSVKQSDNRTGTSRTLPDSCTGNSIQKKKSIDHYRISKLSPFQVRLVDSLASGKRLCNLAREKNMNYHSLKNEIHYVLELLGVRNYIQLVVYWKCPLFRLGMKELGLI